MNRLSALLSLSSGDTSTIIPAPPVGGIAPGTGPADHVIVRIAVIRDLYASEDSRSESKLRSWMRAAGIQVDRCYFDEAHELCPDRLRAFDRLQVIVCVGNQALRLFTGHGDITKRRGSVYEWRGKKVIGVIPPGMVQRHKAFEVPCRIDMERVKALTTPHVTHNYYCACAVRRKRNHITPFNTAHHRHIFNSKIAEYLLWAQEESSLLSIDIETPKVKGKREIVCVGFAFSAEESLTLAWNEANYEVIKLLIESPCNKVGHNFVSFDRWWLKRHGISVGGRIFDSLCESHALNPAGRHSLDYLQSVHTWEPYHKDEGKGHDVSVISHGYPPYVYTGNDPHVLAFRQKFYGEKADKIPTTGWPEYFAYCGLDACLSWELHELFWPRLVVRGLVPFYEQHYEALYDPILELMSRGVRIDHEYRETALYDLLQEAREARDTLGEINGAPLFTLTTKRDKDVYAALLRGNTDDLPYPPDLVAKSLDTISKKTVSGAQLKVLLYEKMGLPPQTKRRSTGDETVTADSVTLRKLKIDHPEAAQVIDLAQQHNKAQKLASFLYPGTFDEDGRFRFTLRLNTEASRFASSAAPNGTGRNSQNSPRDKRIRRIMLPEKGHVLLEADLSQVEGRLCFIYTGDAELIRLARLRASEFDQHNFVVSILDRKPGTIFGLPLEELPAKSDERQASKSLMHAFQRDMQAQTAVDTLLRQDERFIYTVDETQAMLDILRRKLPAIPAWHAETRKTVRRDHCLTSSWGHTWDVRYDEINDDLFRRAYSWKMQRDAAGLLNMQGFIPLDRWLKKEKMQSLAMFQVHDSLVCSCSLNEAYDIALFLKDHLEAPREYDGTELSVPVEFSVGKNYGNKIEMQELPDRADFDKIALTCIA